MAFAIYKRHPSTGRGFANAVTTTARVERQRDRPHRGRNEHSGLKPMKRLASAVLMTTAALFALGMLIVCPAHPVSAQEVKNHAAPAPPEIIAALKKQFPDIEEDNVWFSIGGWRCKECLLVWFETAKGNWACNVTLPVKIRNCWKRHA
jgi:hypothetical protein